MYYHIHTYDIYIIDLALAETGEIHVTIKRGDPYDKWRVPSLGVHSAALFLKCAEVFDPAVYPGMFFLVDRCTYRGIYM